MKRCSTSLIVREIQIKTTISIILHLQNGHHQEVYKQYMAERMWRKETFLNYCGNASWYSHYREQCGNSLKNWEQKCHMTWQSHCQAYTLRKPEMKDTLLSQCSLKHYLQMEATQMSTVSECIWKLWYIDMMVYYTTIRRN